MPDYTTAWSAIADYIETQWADQTPLIVDDFAVDVPNADAWVRLTIRHTDGNQSTMGSPGSNRFRRFGIVTMQIFQRQGEFGITARELAENALAIFTGAENSGIYYYNATVREIGNDGRGWFQINVISEFRYDEIT